MVASGFGVCTHQGESRCLFSARSRDLLQDRTFFVPSHFPPALLPLPEETPLESWESGRRTVAWEGWRGQARGAAVTFTPHRTRMRVFESPPCGV